MKKKVLPLILSMAMVAGVLAGCGSKAGSSSSPSESAKTETTQGVQAKPGEKFGLSVMTLGVEFFTGLKSQQRRYLGM